MDEWIYSMHIWGCCGASTQDFSDQDLTTFLRRFSSSSCWYFRQKRHLCVNPESLNCWKWEAKSQLVNRVKHFFEKATCFFLWWPSSDLDEFTSLLVGNSVRSTCFDRIVFFVGENLSLQFLVVEWGTRGVRIRFLRPFQLGACGLSSTLSPGYFELGLRAKNARIFIGKMQFYIPSLKLTAKAPANRPSQKGNYSIPTIHFQYVYRLLLFAGITNQGDHYRLMFEIVPELPCKDDL